jgi:TP901 family phage tail tape measure protein
MALDLATLAIEADTTDLDKLDKGLDKVTKSSKKTETATGSLNKEFKQMGIVVAAAGVATVAAITSIGVVSVKVFTDLESRMIGVQKTTDFTTKEMTKFRGEINEIGRRVPVATASLLDIAGVAGQLGIKGVDNVSKFTETIAKLSLATDVVGEEGAASIARMLNVAGEGIDTVDTFAAVLVRLGNNSAATESEILGLATEVGQATATFSVSSAEALAMAAAMKSIGVRAELGGSVVGRAMRAIESSIEAGGDKIRQLSIVTGIAENDLKRAFETNATAVFQRFVGGIGGVIEGGTSAASALGEFGLKGEEILKVLPTMAVNAGIFNETLRLANDELERGTALNKEADKAAESLASQWQLGKNVVGEYGFTIGEALAPTLKKTLGYSRDWHIANGDLLKDNLSDWINSGAESIVKFVGVATTLDEWFQHGLADGAILWQGFVKSLKLGVTDLQYAFLISFDKVKEAAAEMLLSVGGNLTTLPGMGEDIGNSFKEAAFSMRQSLSASEDYEAELARINAEYELNVRNLKGVQDGLLKVVSGYGAVDNASSEATKNQLKNITDIDKKSEKSTKKKIKAIDRETTETRYATRDQLRLKKHLECETNKLTQSELEYKLDALEEEVMAMSETADIDRELQDAITDYHSLQQDKIIAKYDETEIAKRKRAVETGKILRETNEVVIGAFIRGEDTKVAIAGLASKKLTDFAVSAATTGLEKILSALGIEIGAHAALGTAQSATAGETWQEKVGSGLAYLGGAGAAILAGKALGNSFADGGQVGWLVQNQNGGPVNGGSGVADDIFAGFTRNRDGGITRNMIMGGEYVVNKKATAKHRDKLEAINNDRFADGGPISDPKIVTEEMNDAGFDVFVDSVISSKGNWKKAIVDGIAYYAGSAAGMITGKKLGPSLFADGGAIPVSTKNYGLGDLLDPFGIGEKAGKFLPGGLGGIDWGNLWDLLRNLNITGVETADDILMPFVRDMLTPSTFIPGADAAILSLEGALKGTAEDIMDQLLPGVKITWGNGGVLGSYESGTDYVPQTGPYMLHKGEDVTTAPVKSEMLALLKDIKDGNVLIVRNTLESMKILRRWDINGLPPTRT